MTDAEMIELLKESRDYWKARFSQLSLQLDGLHHTKRLPHIPLEMPIDKPKVQIFEGIGEDPKPNGRKR